MLQPLTHQRLAYQKHESTVEVQKAKTNWVQEFAASLVLYMPYLVVLRPLGRVSFSQKVILISKLLNTHSWTVCCKAIFSRKKRVLQKGTSFSDTLELTSNRLARSSTVLLSMANLLKPTKASFTNLANLFLCDSMWVWINWTKSNF